MLLTIKDIHEGDIEIDTNKLTGLICDIDGTVADNSHRSFWLNTKPKNWSAYNQRMDLDGRIHAIAEVVEDVYILGVPVVFCSGREEIYKDVTEGWIYRNLGIRDPKLYMRREKDYRKDSIVKEELYREILSDGYRPNLVLDDRNQVVDMWRTIPELTTIQVAEGNF